MPTVRDLLSRKSGTVHTVHPQMTVLAATQEMNEYKIGAVVVMRDDCIVGMFTERDVLRRVVADERPPSTTLVGDVMTRDVLVATLEMAIEEAAQVFRDRRIRHLPVCDGHGRLLGLISIGDLNAYHARAQEETIDFLNVMICR